MGYSIVVYVTVSELAEVLESLEKNGSVYASANIGGYSAEQFTQLIFPSDEYTFSHIELDPDDTDGDFEEFQRCRDCLITRKTAAKSEPPADATNRRITPEL